MAKRTSKRRKLDQLGICPTPDGLWKRIKDTDLRSLLCRDQAIAAAFAIHNGDPLKRAELEARVLADQPQAEIAAKMVLPQDAVAEYEDWFFDVRSRLESTSWIAYEAIRCQSSDGLLAGDVEPFWRWIGYNYGPTALESFLMAVDPQTLRIKGLDAYLQNDRPLDRELKLLVLAKRLPVPITAQQSIRQFRLLNDFSKLIDLQTEDLLSPLKLELSPFSEPKIAVRPFESEGIETVEGLFAVSDVKSCLVFQTQAA